MSINLIKSLKSAAAAVLLAWVGAANADVLQFSLSGGYTAQWQMNSTATSDKSLAGRYSEFYGVPGMFPGSVSATPDLVYYGTLSLGGLSIYDSGSSTILVNASGPQLYSGPEDRPTFLTGTFMLTSIGTPTAFTLTVTDLDAPATPPTTSVPEPATGAMLFGGLGLIAMLRKRRTARTTVCD